MHATTVLSGAAAASRALHVEIGSLLAIKMHGNVHSTALSLTSSRKNLSLSGSEQRDERFTSDEAELLKIKKKPSTCGLTEGCNL